MVRLWTLWGTISCSVVNADDLSSPMTIYRWQKHLVILWFIPRTFILFNLSIVLVLKSCCLFMAVKSHSAVVEIASRVIRHILRHFRMKWMFIILSCKRIYNALMHILVVHRRLICLRSFLGKYMVVKRGLPFVLWIPLLDLAHLFWISYINYFLS